MSDQQPADPAVRRPWLTRNVKVLSAVSLAQDAASELMYPILPVLLTSVLGAPAAVVGMVEGIAEGAAAALKYLSGRWSDRFGRKPAVALGYGLAALGKVVIAAASAWPAVLAGRVVDRVGKGIRGAPRDALLADGVANNDLGKVFGFHRAADTLGAVIGPLLGMAVLAATGDNLGAALWFAVVPAAISVALVGLTREGPRRLAARASAGAAAGGDQGGDHEGGCGDGCDPGGGRRADARSDPVTDPGTELGPGHRPGHGTGLGGEPATPPLPGRVRALAGMLGLFALVNFPDALLLLRMNELGFSPVALAGAYALFNAANAAIAYPAGALSDRWPRSRVYALGLVCFAVGYVGLGLAREPWLVLVLLLVYGGFAGITDGVGKAWVSALAPPAVRGHAQGLFQALSGLGILVAGVWAGLAWDAGPGQGVVPLVLSGAVAAVCAGLLLVLGRRLDA